MEFIYLKGGDGAGLSANPGGAKERERWKAGPFKWKAAHAHWGFAHERSPNAGCNAWWVHDDDVASFPVCALPVMGTGSSRCILLTMLTVVYYKSWRIGSGRLWK